MAARFLVVMIAVLLQQLLVQSFCDAHKVHCTAHKSSFNTRAPSMASLRSGSDNKPTSSNSIVSTAVHTVISTAVNSPEKNNKRGLLYNQAALLQPFIASSGFSWAANWASSSETLPSNIEFVPMLWGLDASSTNTWMDHVGKSLRSGSTHILAFNEPDIESQANIDPNKAAAGYLQYIEPFAERVRLGSPAVSNSGPPGGLTFLKEFLNACSNCSIDFCAIHWYDSPTNIDYFMSYMAEAYDACGRRPIWITEFAAVGTEDEQVKFLRAVLPWLDRQDYIERYAYFMVDNNHLLTGGGLNSVGMAYLSIH